jgi:glycerophosphoryl diester phosphodiesterase
MIKALFNSISIIAFLLIVGGNAFAQKAIIPTCKNKFVIIAHRGNHVAAPENTLKAYQNAIDEGVDYIEIDLRNTKDSVLVIMHDSKIDRMTNGKGFVRDYLFDSLRQIKVRNADQPTWGEHLIPSFTEVLELCKGKINIYLDFKEASVAATYECIKRAGMDKNVVVYINSISQFKEWRSIAPQMPLIVSLPQKIKTKEAIIQLLSTFKVDILDGSFDEYNAETVNGATERGIPIWADIQSPNEAELWNKALLIGLKGLQTDHPKELIEYLKSKNIR